jgi:hypothetical protein
MAEHKQCQVQKSTLKKTMKLTLFGTTTTRGASEDGVIDDGSLRAPPHSEFHLVLITETHLLGLVPTRTETIALGPTFASFTLLELISRTSSFDESALDCLDWNGFFLLFGVWIQKIDRCTTSYLLAGPPCL